MLHIGLARWWRPGAAASIRFPPHHSPARYRPRLAQPELGDHVLGSTRRDPQLDGDHPGRDDRPGQHVVEQGRQPGGECRPTSLRAGRVRGVFNGSSQSEISTHTAAWPLAFSQPRTARATSAAISRGFHDLMEALVDP